MALGETFAAALKKATLANMSEEALKAQLLVPALFDQLPPALQTALNSANPPSPKEILQALPHAILMVLQNQTDTHNPVTARIGDCFFNADIL